MRGRSLPVFGETVRRKTALPLPFAGAIVAQLSSLRAVHVHAACVPIAISDSPPVWGMTVGTPEIV